MNSDHSTSASGACLDISALPELPESAANMYPCDLKRFEFGEHCADAFSIPVGSPTHGKSAPLFTADQMREYGAACKSAAASQSPNGSDLLASHQRLKDALQKSLGVLAGQDMNKQALIHALSLSRAALKAAP